MRTLGSYCYMQSTGDKVRYSTRRGLCSFDLIVVTAEVSSLWVQRFRLESYRITKYPELRVPDVLDQSGSYPGSW